jgi:hypothetical protein
MAQNVFSFDSEDGLKTVVAKAAAVMRSGFWQR